MDRRVEQIDDIQRKQGKKIVVLETVVSEIRDHMIKVETKLDNIYEIYTKTQGTLSSLVELQKQINENTKWISSSDVYIQKWIKDKEQNAGILKKNASVIVMAILVAFLAMYVRFSTQPHQVEAITEAQIISLIEQYGKETIAQQE